MIMYVTLFSFLFFNISYYDNLYIDIYAHMMLSSCLSFLFNSQSDKVYKLLIMNQKLQRTRSVVLYKNTRVYATDPTTGTAHADWYYRGARSVRHTTIVYIAKVHSFVTSCLPACIHVYMALLTHAAPYT
jgi:hypothetical protein